MTASKLLVVNADDLGRTPGVNRGIDRAHRSGIVTSATLLVGFPAAQEVPALCRENPGLGVGLHVAFTGGPATLPPGAAPSLVGAGGALPADPDRLSAVAFKDLLAEARAQLRRFRDLMGREPTHLDTHHHAHLLPTVLEALITLAWETGLPVRSLLPDMRARLRREGIPTPDHFVREFHGAGVTLEALVHRLSDMPLGVTELMCHPAEVDSELRAGSRYAEPRAEELRILTDPEVRQVVQAAGIRLVSYAALAPRLDPSGRGQ